MKHLLFYVVLFITICTLPANAQQKKVSGTVISAVDGTPIEFASVSIRGTTTATSTDEKGFYTITVSGSNDILVFDVLGMKLKEALVGQQTEINVALEEDVFGLDEVIVVAYGTAKKSTFTGSASVVGSDKFKDAPVTSFESALNGKIAGMQVTSNSGQAGSATNIRIRGVGSMNASNEPLYVIDGVPAISGDQSQMGSYIYTSSSVMSSINPADIESITILKDAAASALYGSRAANGVIIVTTKRGKAGQPKINFKTSISLTPTFATDNWERATTEQAAEMLYELFWNGYKEDGRTDEQANTRALTQMNNRFNRHGYSFSTTDNTPQTLKISGLTDGIVNREGKYYDWEDALLRTAVFQNYDLSVSGGNDKTTVYSSLGYTRDKGMSIANDFSRISGRVNLNQKVGKYVEFTTNVGLSHSTKEGFNDTRNIRDNYFYLTRNMLWGMYWPTDYKTGNPWTAQYGSSARNPLYYNKEWDNSSKTLKTSASETLAIKILPVLTLKSIFSYDNTNIKDHLYYSALHYSASTTGGSITEMATDVTKWVSSTTLNFDKTFAEKHNVTVLAGFEAEENTTNYLYTNGTQLPTSTLHTVSTAGTTTASGYNWGYAMESMLSRAEYNYDSKYYASASFRRDGSSRFGPSTRWGNFWSLSGAWTINREKFLENISDISNLRLRVAYGSNGTLPSSNYGWRSLASYTAKYMEKPGGGLANIGNEDLTWEYNYTTNIGLDFGLFKNKLRGSIEYFNRDSKDLLQDVPVSHTTGFTSTLKNVGEMNNRGWEVEIGGDIIRNNDWTWDASLTASFIKSKITKLYGGSDIFWYDPTGSDSRIQYVYREGESNLSLFGLEWAGVDQTNGKNVWYTNNDYNDTNIKGFKKNVSYDYDDADEIILADMNPKVFGGINTSLTWKNITLGTNFIYKLGGYTYDAMSRDINDDGYYWERIMAADTYDGRWTYSKGEGRYPMRTDKDLEDAMQYSSRHKNPADFLRLKTISLAYALPKNLLKKAGINDARIYFSGTNLLTFAAYDLYDPEVGVYAGRGWEMPIGKTYTFGLELSF
ncbi:SusC/RagA family TonB-linked outer membrane protein [Bacteroidia bacterium]|nr:SusC/RagA family TonB-linked outer membrane protein [Bacteroidia bacterium]GHT28474.1 SusC/RagA family TonB-linked outer membrane protein [Bacteroidia bacterium]